MEMNGEGKERKDGRKIWEGMGGEGGITEGMGGGNKHGLSFT